MSAETAVFDAGPFIAFPQIDRLDLLNDFFARSVVPHAVAREVSPSLGSLPV
jgi:predicted nucleic acid-binding protein